MLIKWTYAQLRQVKSEIQAIVDAAVKDKKTGTRKAAAAAMLADSEQVLGRASEEALARACEPTTLEAQAPEPLDPGVDDDIPEFASSARSTEVMA